MKTKLLAVLALSCLSLFSAPISGTIAGAGGTLVAPISGGDTSITFISNPFALTLLSSLVPAGGSGVSTITPLTVNNASPFQIDWAGGLSFTAIAPTPLVTSPAPGTFAIHMAGTYSSTVPGFDPTPGMLAFTFQDPDSDGLYSFSYSGSTVPEPKAAALMGAALIALGLRGRLRRS